MQMTNKALMRGVVVLAVCLVLGETNTAQATILLLGMDTNNSVDNINSMYPTYGDNVAGPLANYYAEGGEGYTPNLTTTWNGVGTGWVTFGSTGFTPLTGVAYLPPTSGTASIEFQADPGYTVRLLDFALANWEPQTVTYENIQVFGAAGNPLTSPMTYTVPTGTTIATLSSIWPSFSYFEDTKITLSMTNTSGTTFDWVAFDNIRFSQHAIVIEPEAVPEPSSLVLFGLAGLGLIAWRWCRKI